MGVWGGGGGSPAVCKEAQILPLFVGSPQLAVLPHGGHDPTVPQPGYGPDEDDDVILHNSVCFSIGISFNLFDSMAIENNIWTIIFPSF